MSSGEVTVPPDPENPGGERLKIRLLELYAQLESAIAFAEGDKEPDPDGPASWLYDVRSAVAGERPREILQRWMYLFREEIQLVRVVRNTVAHARYVSDENLTKAVEVAEYLLKVARSSVSRVAAKRRPASTPLDPR